MTRRETRRSKNGDSKLLEQQLAYYRARAPEYDEWFLRQGRYDRGAQHRSEWFREVALIERELQHLVRGKDVLELAAGTGLWTKRVAHSAKRVLAIDGSPEAIGINRNRLRNSDVEYQIADIFTWQPRRTFDVVFFSFWLSHVPSQRFETFWGRSSTSTKSERQRFFYRQPIRANINCSGPRPAGPVGYSPSQAQRRSCVPDCQSVLRTGKSGTETSGTWLDRSRSCIRKVFYLRFASSHIARMKVLKSRWTVDFDETFSGLRANPRQSI